jgi:hypothetical protein
VKLIHEPVNTRVDHPGALLDRTADAVTVARAVNSGSFGILDELYHSVTEGEGPAAELAGQPARAAGSGPCRHGTGWPMPRIRRVSRIVAGGRPNRSTRSTRARSRSRLLGSPAPAQSSSPTRT